MLRLFVVLIVFVLTGCGSDEGIRRFSAHYPESQADAGTVTVAVVSIERWQDVVGELKPDFRLSGEEALKKVLPATAALQQQVLDSLSASFSAALPTVTTTRTETVTKADGAPRTTDTKNIEQQETSGTPPTPAALGDPKSLPSLDGINGLFKDTIRNNPVLEYQTALALFQEVRLLNRYVEAAAGRHGFTPYLVRLQIGVTPYAHRQPYDVYTRIGFFNEIEDVCKIKPRPADGLPRQLMEEKLDRDRCKELYTFTPEVIPLVVTDDIELTRQARATEVVRQLQAGLSGTLQGVGAAGQLQALNDQLQSLAGNSLNSLSSVTRLSDNTVQARFGAVNDPSITDGDVDRSMVNRNYFVSLLLLVPEPFTLVSHRGAVRLMARSNMRLITDGSEFSLLPENLFRQFRERLVPYNKLIKRESNSEWKFEEIINVLAYVQDGNFKDFSLMFSKSQKPLNQIIMASLWTDMAGLAASFGLHTETIDLPRYEPPSLPPRQAALIRDDRTSGIAAVRLQGGGGLLASRLEARLDVVTKSPLAGTQVTGNVYSLPAESIIVNSDSRDVLLTFPSLERFGISPSDVARTDIVLRQLSDPRYESYARPLPTPKGRLDGKAGVVRGEIIAGPFAVTENSQEMDQKKREKGDATTRYDCPGDKTALRGEACYYIGAYRSTPAAKPGTGFEISLAVGRIALTPNSATGSVRLRVAFGRSSDAADTVKIAVSNAELLGATGDATDVSTEKNELFVSGPAGATRVVVLELGQLVNGETVTVSAAGTRDGKAVVAPAPLSIPVRATSGAKPGGG